MVADIKTDFYNNNLVIMKYIIQKEKYLFYLYILEFNKNNSNIK